MSDPKAGDSAEDLRAAWRKGEEASSADAETDPDGDRRRQDDALGSNDRIRDDAPDDLETRRGADQLEREIKRARAARKT
ncbi:MAG TPA: hypothetical protein VFW95_06500 [Candidatus Limnocylindria bacterium]|nr:hypothetical protein [Candidatus Limnocylindria bacterium]